MPQARNFTPDMEMARQRRENVRDSESRLVIMGDGRGRDPSVNLYARNADGTTSQRVWVRDIGGEGVPGYTGGGLPYRVLPGVGPTPQFDKQVWIKWETGVNDWRIHMSDPDYMDVVGQSMHLENPSDPSNQFHRTEQLLPLRAQWVGQGKISVQGYAYTHNGIGYEFPGTDEDTHIVAIDEAPAAGEQCYILLVYNFAEFAAANFPIQFYLSTPKDSVTETLGLADLNECIAQMDPTTSREIWAFRLSGDETEYYGHRDDRDRRGWLNTPLAIPDDFITGDMIADGAITIPKLSSFALRVTAADPTVNDDSADGYHVGSRWINSATGDEFVLVDSTVGVAAWTKKLTAPTGAANLVFATPNGSSGAATLRAIVPADLTSALASPPPIGGTAQAAGYFSALRLYLGGFYADFTHAFTADRTVTLPGDANVTLVGVATTQTLTVKTLTSPKINEILDSNGNELLKFTTTASAVNELTLANAATGGKPALTATGGDTNIGIDILPKGTGVVNIDGAVVINESGADRDVRIEGDTITSLFFTDASADRIGIGTTSPTTAILDVAGAINVQGDASAVGIYFVPGKAWIRSTGGGFMDVGTAGAGTLNFRMGSGFVSTLLLNNDSTVNIGSIAAGIARLAVYGAASAKALVAVANATGSANIVEAQNSSNTVLASIASTGAGLFNALDASSTSAVTTALTTGHNIAGTPAASFGTAMVFQAKSSTTNDQALGAIDGYWNVASHATRAGQIDIAANYTSTKQVGFSVRGDTGGVKTSVNGATPVARQTAGAATAGATYTATEQTMLQVVYDAVRNFGITT